MTVPLDALCRSQGDPGCDLAMFDTGLYAGCWHWSITPGTLGCDNIPGLVTSAKSAALNGQTFCLATPLSP